MIEKATLEKHGFIEEDEVTKNDIFLIEHHEELFYLNPKELAKAINAMDEDRLLMFNENTQAGYGCNAELMRDKLEEMQKYMTVNMPIFGEAFFRTMVRDHDSFLEIKKFFAEKGKRSGLESVDALFMFYSKFREHFPILEAKGVIKKKPEGGLDWTLSTISLAQYFEYLNADAQRNRWSIIEKVFYVDNVKVRNLRQYLYNHNERQYSKPSEDFKRIKEILALDN